MRIVDQLLLNVDKNRVSSLILIDCCKTCDMVDHELLLMKLKTYGISETSYKWFESYLQGRQQFVSLGGGLYRPGCSTWYTTGEYSGTLTFYTVH